MPLGGEVVTVVEAVAYDELVSAARNVVNEARIHLWRSPWWKSIHERIKILEALLPEEGMETEGYR